MTTLDTLARSSAGAIHHSVAYVPVRPTSITGAVAKLAFWTFGRYIMAGAVAGIILVGALFIVGPNDANVTGDSTPPTTAVTPTTVATAIPETDLSEANLPEPNVIVPTTVVDPVDHNAAPVVPPAALAPETTTTSVALDVEPPLLKIDSPNDGDRFETAVLRFSGRTEVGASVLASGKFAATVASDGSWYIDLVLAPGANGVVFAASDVAGNKTAASVTVFFDEPKTVETTTTTSTTVVTWEFTANQKYGSCELPVPYDIFSGKTKPGANVTVSSPYGNGTATANADGAWSVKVEFPTAPFNVPFVVSATDYKGTTKTFEFVNLYSG
ncbi:MAG: hypothetical protein BMS9Abin17_1468 [Acidimicrobiia bacterium]|nr:MAG: hypothetical protein BMS9Abin17_1468 [Acidimicrobiia bacterium]